jgi:hypothetical protein
LNIRGLSDYLANGNLWQTCPTINGLRKFNFIIEFDDSPINLNRIDNQILYSFSTPFWQDIKKWYVAITPQHMYTISCFNDQLFHSSTLPPLSTSPDNHWFYVKTKQIKIDKNLSSTNLHRFHNIEKLEILEENIRLSIDSINQFTHLRHLIFHQSISNIILSNILIHNPHIDHLTLSQNDFNQLFPLKTIHYLYFQDLIQISHRTQIKDLCQVFPFVKQLFINLNSRRFICQIINNFHYLENIVFNFHELIKPISQEWLKENTRLNNNIYSFTCRNEPNRFLLWISNSVSNQFIVKNSY